MASLYPNAKFVLTLRRSEDAWLERIKRHTMCRMWEGYEIVYGALEATHNEGAYLNAYRNHTYSVREFFASPGQEGRLLEMVIDEPESFKGEKWVRLCEFLGLGDKVVEKVQRQNFPWSNDGRSSKDITLLWRARTELYGSGEIFVRGMW